MGSRLLRKAILTFLVIVVQFLFLLGCPQPRWIPIRFYTDSKQVKEYIVNLESVESSLTIKGKHDAHFASTPVIKIYIEAKYKNGAASDFKFVHNAPKLLLNGKELAFMSSDQIHIPDTNVIEEMLSPFSDTPYYGFVVDSATYFENDRFQFVRSTSLKLVLDDFVYYRNSIIQIDTILCSFY